VLRFPSKSGLIHKHTVKQFFRQHKPPLNIPQAPLYPSTSTSGQIHKHIVKHIAAAKHTVKTYTNRKQQMGAVQSRPLLSIAKKTKFARLPARMFSSSSRLSTANRCTSSRTSVCMKKLQTFPHSVNGQNPEVGISPWSRVSRVIISTLGSTTYITVYDRTVTPLRKLSRIQATFSVPFTKLTVV
jgi:hypothetical protein